MRRYRLRPPPRNWPTRRDRAEIERMMAADEHTRIVMAVCPECGYAWLADVPDDAATEPCPCCGWEVAV